MQKETFFYGFKIHLIFMAYFIKTLTVHLLLLPIVRVSMNIFFMEQKNISIFLSIKSIHLSIYLPICMMDQGREPPNKKPRYDKRKDETSIPEQFLKGAYWISSNSWFIQYCSPFCYRSSNFAIAKLSLLLTLKSDSEE